MPYAMYSRAACQARILARERSAESARQAIADIGRRHAPVASTPENDADIAACSAEFSRLLAEWAAAGKPDA